MTPRARPHPTVAAALAVVGAAVLFGTTGTAQALGPGGTTPIGVGGLRIVVGAVALWAIARRRVHRASLADLGWLVLGAVGVAGYQPAFFTGTERCGVALGTIVALGAGPAFAGALDAALLRRRPASSWWRATAVASTGGAVLVGAQGGEVRVDGLGLAASVTAGLAYALYAVATKALIDRGWDSTTALATQFSIGAAVLAPLTLAQPLAWVVSGEGALMLAHLGVVTVGVAYWLYGIGLRTLPTSTAVLLTLAEPVTAALAAVVVLDETLAPLGWLGAGIVLVGLALGTRPRAVGRGQAPSEMADVGRSTAWDVTDGA